MRKRRKSSAASTKPASPPVRKPRRTTAQARRKAKARDSRRVIRQVARSTTTTRQNPANPSRSYWRVNSRIPWKNPGGSAVSKSSRRSRTGSGRRRSAGKYGGGGGVMSDFKAIPATLGDIAKRPVGLAWAGGGALGTMVAGGIVGAQLGRVMPSMGAGMARLVNAAAFAGVAVALSRIPKDQAQRRQLLAGGLAVALIELAKPGATAAFTSRIPGVGGMLMPSDPYLAARMPAAQADPRGPVAAAASAALPWYRRGGNWNPANWAAAQPAAAGVSGLGEIYEGEPIAIDGIADDDPSMMGVGDDGEMPPTADGQPGVGEVVHTYLNGMDGLGCMATRPANELTKLIIP